MDYYWKTGLINTLVNNEINRMITANKLKTKGISVIQAELEQQTEAVISVRGKQRFVVVNIEHYNYLHECELSAAIIESEADIRIFRGAIGCDGRVKWSKYKRLYSGSGIA